MNLALYQLHTAYGKHTGKQEGRLISNTKAYGYGPLHYCPKCLGFYVQLADRQAPVDKDDRHLPAAYEYLFPEWERFLYWTDYLRDKNDGQ